MKIKNLSRTVAFALIIVVHLALLRTIAEPLISSLTHLQLIIILASALLMAAACLAMTILTALSRINVNTFVAAGTLIALVVVKIAFLQ